METIKYLSAGLFILIVILSARLVNLKRSILDLKGEEIQKKKYSVDLNIRENETPLFDPALASLFYQKPGKAETVKPTSVPFKRVTNLRYIGVVETGCSRIHSFRDTVTGKLVLYNENSVPIELKDQIIKKAKR